MKKVIVSAVLFVGAVLSSQAQDISKNSIGLRLGDNDGFGAEISYQRRLTPINRLEFDLGWRNSDEVDAIKLAGMYQWVWNIDKGLNWYAGAGGGIGSWSYSNEGESNDGTFVFISGNLGIEYQFDFPLQLTLDVRPEIYLLSGDYRETNFGPDLALGIRYRFD
ncbi:hypothetical protein [Flavobacterium sp.]|jgi:hypothetical protein|uniref:hypothetical protein n=1 Tax=Flavobacterium sp. TaxID=239 RepID=UPI0037C1955B